ncbi:MAG: helix-turn-helix domain-containing protein [Clostridiales Family XIII bacterium]|jgi:sugar diacid utilization regulator|nr:helix-turn-helix domain-containing protein [Clostridiales Family XIII bacterium]
MARVPFEKQRELIWKLSRSRSLWDLADVSCELLGNPVFFVDTNHMILAYTKSVKIDDPMWQKGIVQGSLEGRTLRESSEVRSNHKRSADEDCPILVPKHKEFPHTRIVRTIISKGEPIGVFIDSGTFCDCTEDDIVLVDIIAAFAQPLIKQRYVCNQRKAQSMGNFLIGLLNGAVETELSLEKRMKGMEFKIYQYWYILVFTQECSESGFDDSPLMEELLRDISAASRASAFVHDNQIVCVIGIDAPVVHWPDTFPELTEQIRRYKLIVGVSRYFTSLVDMRTHYLEAVNAIDIGTVLQHHNPYMFTDELSIYRMFRSVKESLDVYCSQKVRDLDDYDKKHKSDLCRTLQVFLENKQNFSRAADILFIHKNTVRYRVEQCMRLLFGHSENEEDLFTIQLSLRILEYERKFLKK